MFDSSWVPSEPGELVSYAGAVRPPEFSEHAHLVALLRLRPERLNWLQLAQAVVESGSAQAVWAELVGDQLFVDETSQAALTEAGDDVRLWSSAGLDFWPITDPQYPARVRDIHQAPPFLFSRGQRRDEDVAVSVVGSRKASARGLQMASNIARVLVEHGVTVVAGLAAGIDTAAHRTALENDGRTVAVIGTGLNVTYPAANRELQETIAQRGQVLSQFWPDAPPQPHNFPMRNAVMSGYGVATVVVEAGEHSGARIQARMAVEHGRPVILTDLVTQSTEWGKALLERPDVFLAASTAEVLDIIEGLLSRQADLHDSLHSIAV